MRRFSFGVTLVALPAFALSLILAGCGGGKDSSSSSTGGGEGGGGGDKKREHKEAKVLEPGKGVLKGEIKLNGKPNLEALTEKLKEEMKKKDGEYCMKGSESETTEQAYRISDKGLLGNVFVWIIPEDKDTIFKVEKKQLESLEKKVKIRQPHCAFIPHCAFLFAEYHANPKKPKDTEKTGQVLDIVNDATISHNTNWKGSVNKGDNVLIGEGKTRIVDNLLPEAAQITIACNIHAWMNGYLRVVDTPYYAISHSDTLDGKDKVEKSDAKFGTYEIHNLPAGKVRVLAWHEVCGYLNKDGGKGEVIEILPEKPTEKNFDATAK